MSFFQIFQYISGSSAIIPLIVGLIYFKKFKSYSKWTLLLVSFSLLMDLLSFYTRSKGLSTLPYVHQFFFWQVPLVFLIFINSNVPRRFLFYFGLGVTMISIALMIYFLWNKWNFDFMVIQVPWISTIGCILISIIYLFGRISYAELDEKLVNTPLMIFGLILIYQCSIVSTFAAFAANINDVYMLKLSVYILFNIILAIIFYRLPKTDQWKEMPKQ